MEIERNLAHFIDRNLPTWNQLVIFVAKERLSQLKDESLSEENLINYIALNVGKHFTSVGKWLLTLITGSLATAVVTDGATASIFGALSLITVPSIGTLYTFVHTASNEQKINAVKTAFEAYTRRIYDNPNAELRNAKLTVEELSKIVNRKIIGPK